MRLITILILTSSLTGLLTLSCSQSSDPAAIHADQVELHQSDDESPLR